MKTAAFAVLALLACSAAGTQGRRLLAEDVSEGCGADLSALAGFPDLSGVAGILQGFGLLPNGIPADATLFLPTNDAFVTFLAGLPVPGLTMDNLVEMASVYGDIVVEPLVSALLYHVAPIGAQEPAVLVEEGTIVTALTGFTLTFGADAATGMYTVTDATGAVAMTTDPTLACGSAIYPVDKVLMPAELLSIPPTTLAEAIAILSGGAAASPAPAPAAA